MAFFSRAAAAQSRVGGSRANVSRPGSWEARGDQFLRPPTQRPGAVAVEAQEMAREMRALLTAAAPAVSFEISRALIPAAEWAYDNWPVSDRNPKRHDPPVHSKELLALEYSVLTDTTWMATFANRADYALMIRRGRTARKFIFKRGERAAKTAAGRIAKTIAEKV